MIHRLLDTRRITESVSLLSFEKKEFSFAPGQYLMAGPEGLGHLREYSIASSPVSDVLRILVKRIDSGFVSPRLTELKSGDFLEIRGPYGEFLLPEEHRGLRFLFAASGTGIAPFAGITAAVPGLDYRLLHGVRYDSERYLREEFPEERLRPCITRAVPGFPGYRGRVTDYFLDHQQELLDFDMIYACGNSDMIYELFHLARRAGFRRDQLRAEIYF